MESREVRVGMSERVVLCPVCGLVSAAEHYSGFGNDYVCGVNRAAYDGLADSDLDVSDEEEGVGPCPTN